MSIKYCSLIAKVEKVVLVESTVTESYDYRIKPLVPTILKKNVCDIIEIEGDMLVTYLRTKKVIFICVSESKHGDERPRRFIEQFAAMVIKEFDGIDNILPTDGVGKLALQAKLDLKFNNLLANFDTGMYKNKDLISGMNKDLEDIKHDIGDSIKKIVGDKDNLDEMLLTSKKIVAKAEEYKDDAHILEKETRCLKPWMIYLMIIFIVLITVYTCFSFYLCGNLSLFCERKIVRSRPRLLFG